MCYFLTALVWAVIISIPSTELRKNTEIKREKNLDLGQEIKKEAAKDRQLFLGTMIWKVIVIFCSRILWRHIDNELQYCRSTDFQRK